MKNLLVIAVLAFTVMLSPQADAWVTKKKYAQWLESLPPEGEKPTEEYAKEAALAYLNMALKDSESARYEWGQIELGNWRGGTERFGTPGWILSVDVNAKNSYGGYTGFTPYKFVFRSGWIIEVYNYNSRYKAWVPHLGVGNEIRPLPSYAGGSPSDASHPSGQMNYKPTLP